MLKNKVFITFVGISLVAASIYNISFFSNKRKVRSHNQSSRSVNTALASLPTDDERNDVEKDTTLTTFISTPSEVAGNLKLFALENKPWGRNPFLTPEEELSLHTMYLKGTKGEGENATTIDGILIGQSQRVAIIDHTIVTEGDWIGVEQVVKIDKTKAVLAVGKNRREIIMDEPSITITVEESKDSEEKDEI